MSRRILIVDDDPDVRIILCLRLARVGFEVATATDGREGLAALEQAPASGVVLDLYMPGVNGFDFLARLKAHPAPPPVFVVTQADDAAVRARVHGLGAEELISKGDALGREFAELLARRLAVDTHPTAITPQP